MKDIGQIEKENIIIDLFKRAQKLKVSFGSILMFNKGYFCGYPHFYPIK